MVHRYAVEIEIESYAASGRQAVEWALNSLLDGSYQRLKVHVTRMRSDGQPDLGVRGGVYMVDFAMQPVTRVSGTEPEVRAIVAKRPIKGTNAC